MSRRRIRFGVIALALAGWIFSFAATATAEADADQAQPPLTAGWDDGFVIQAANGDYRLILGMVAQTDGRFSLDDPNPITNTFLIRKLRPTFTGRVAKYFDFKVMPDFGNSTTVVLDVYVDVRFSPAFRLRIGKDKTPTGYELLQGDANLWFPERALASSLVPNRDTGVQAQGTLQGGAVVYAAGVFNGIPDGQNLVIETDANGGKDLAGRIVVQPFLSRNDDGDPLKGLGFHIGGSTGQQDGPLLPFFRTSVGQIYFAYGLGTSAHGARNRVTPAAFYFYKALGVFGEYVRSSQGVLKADVQTEVTNTAWDVVGSFFLTGEASTYGQLRPKNNFDPAQRHGGALQVVARYSALTVDRAVLAADLAASGASREAKSWTIGANWYPAPYIKFYGTYERTTFDRESARPSENVILFRTQLAF